LEGFSDGSGNSGDFSLKVTDAIAFNTLDLDSVLSGLLHEVHELECLHLVLAKGTLESEGTLTVVRNALKLESIFEFTKDRVLQDDI